MIQVSIEDIERFAGIVLDEPGPSADAHAGVAPVTRAGDFRRIGKPESPGLGHSETVCSIQNRRVFAVDSAVLAGNSDLAVRRQRLADLVDLETQRLLQTHDVAALFADDVEGHFLAVRPAILAVIGRAVANVETHHSKLKGACSCRSRVGLMKGTKS